MMNGRWKQMWVLSGSCVGALLATLSIALGSVPKSEQVTNDTALYQELSELRVRKEPAPNFDSEIARLSALEGRYQERLPDLASHPRLAGPMKRLSGRKYQPSASSLRR